MRLARKLAVLVLLGIFLIGNLKQPVQAESCQDECASTAAACNNLVDATYQSCMSDCDQLYPWWGGCSSYCFGNRESGWAQCESDYNTCIAGCPP